MANTDIQRFRCDTKTRWEPAMLKLEQMREAGYDVDMTKVLVAEVDRLQSETIEQTAGRLGLTKADGPVSIYRRPAARDSVKEATA